MLLRNIVKVEPTGLAAIDDALCPENCAAGTGIQGLEGCDNLLGGEFLGSFYAPGGEGFVCVMVVMVVVVTAAATVVVVVMMMLVVVVVTAAATVLVIVVVMMLVIVIMTAAAAFLVIVVVMMLVIVIVTAAATVLVVMMMMLVIVVMTATAVMVIFHSGKELGDGFRAFHSVCQLLACQLFPGGSDDGAVGADGANQFACFFQLLGSDGTCPGQDHSRSRGKLIIIKLAKITHIALYLGGIGNGYLEGDLCAVYLFNCRNYIRQLTHTGGLNDDPVGGIIVHNLLQRLTEVANQRAADAAGIHLPDLYACLLQEATVNADLAKLVLNEDNFLPGVVFLQHFLNKRCLAGT